MIKKENIIFLKETFEIDCENYSEETLNKLLDELIVIVNDSIVEKEKKNLNLLKNNISILDFLNKK